MAIPVWPKINYLANQGTGNFTVSDGKGRATSTMDSGAQRTRRRFTQIISPLTETIRLNYDELTIFEYFYRNIVKDGSLWFYMPIQRGNSYTVNLVMFDPQSNPTTSEAGYNVIELSINLLVRNATLISQDAYDYFSALNGADGRSLSDAVTNFVNIVYPKITAEYR